MLSPRYNSPAIFADYPYEPTLLVGYKLSIVLSFPRKFCKRYNILWVVEAIDGKCLRQKIVIEKSVAF